MRHIRLYNEEWNPIEWTKDKIKSVKANKSLSKGIEKVKSMMDKVNVPNATISELDQSSWKVGKTYSGNYTSGPVYVNFTVTTKVNNMNTNLEFNLFSYLNEDGSLRDWSDEGEMKILCYSITFQKIFKFEKKAAGYGGGYNSNISDFYNSQVGRVTISNDYISISNQGGYSNLSDLQNSEIVSSSIEIKDYISKLISNLPKIYDMTIDAIKNKKKSIDDAEKKEKDHKQRISEFKNKQDHIKDCFLDLIDISDEHRFDIDNYGNVSLSLNLKNIKVISQREEVNRGGRYGSETVHFTKAKFEITNELFDVFDLIKDAKSQLMSVDDNIKMNTEFSNNHLYIRVWVDRS